jgi:hypothetical protein
MAFIGFLIFWAISFVAGQLLRAVTTKPQNASPDTPERPRTEEGQQIPAIFGTVKLGPTIVWWGDVEAKPIKKRIQTSIFTSKKETIGFKYLVGMQGGLCWGPVDELVDIILADKKKVSGFGDVDVRIDDPFIGIVEQNRIPVTPTLPESYAAAGTTLTFDAPLAFGGNSGNGGVIGDLAFYFGSLTQNANAYLTTETAQSPFPTYRGLCYAVWEHVYCGNSARIEPWQFVVRRCPTTLGTLAADVTLSRIGEDANPAEVLYELWGDTRWGLAEGTSALDVPSFLAALQTLSDEGLGVSGTHLGASNADEKFKEILRTIDGVITQDPLTGLQRLKLIRADYTLADLEVFTPSNSRELTVSRPDWDELTTEVKVRYTDTSMDFTTRARPAYNPAVRQALGKARGVTVDYPLITTGANAGILALRDLKSLSSTLATGSITLTRIGATLASGDAFVINYPDKGLVNTVVRAGRLNYGTINGKEAVEVSWTEDVFGVTTGTFTADPPDVWVPPTPPVFGDVVVIPVITTSATEVCVELGITGRVDAIGLIEMQGQEGGGTATGWLTFDIDDPPLLCVDRDEKLTGTIAYRVTVTEPDGTTGTIEDEIPVPPIGVDDGNESGVGTPGNLFITMRAGPALVIDAVPAADTRHPEGDTDPVSVSLRKVRAMSAECPVLVAGPTGSLIKIRILPFVDAEWQDGPTIPIDAVNLSGTDIIPQLGATFTVPEELQIDNAILDWVTTGGDDATEATIGNIYLRSTSSATPPDPETPPPGLPTAGLIANWELTEGSGSQVTSKAPVPSGPTLVLGFTTGTESDARFDPSWQTGPRRLRPAGFDLVYSAFSHVANIPSYAAGSACFMYIDIASLGGLPKFLMGIGNSPYTYRMGIDGSNHLFVQITEDSGGGTLRTATGTTTISNGSQHLVGFIHDGTNLKVYVDPDDGLHEGIVACAAALFDATTDLIIGGGGYPPGAGQPDSFDHGDVNYHIGATLPSVVGIAELYAYRKLTYTALP